MPTTLRFPTLCAAACAAGLAGPSAAQIIVVPLEPAPGSGVEGDGLEGDGTGLIPTDPVTGFEPLPPDPGAGWNPIQLDPIDPDAVEPWGAVSEDGPPVLELLPPGSAVGQDVTTVAEDAVTQGNGAVLKGLDKLAGTVEELRLASGETVGLGWLEITLGECRYPVDNPSGDAYAWLEIVEEGQAEPVFRGWMIASSPGLNALDHARFDVWVLNCTLPETPETEATE
ncbi:MAG TPA: hypothetical protein DIU07_08745 [Rhodobacteraceae bacterium]|nr:hypothetical protein [Paracoccaceae bacterium]